MKLALFALDIVKIHYTQSRHINEAITALKERLAQPEQTEVQQLIALVRAQQITIDKLEMALADHAMRETQRLGQEIEQEPVAWRDVIVVNLVREGINKHRARELAEHFIKLTTPPAPQRTWVGLTEEDRAKILSRKWWDFEDEFDVDGFLRLAEAKLKEKNT
jgi:hypothetical protein